MSRVQRGHHKAWVLLILLIVSAVAVQAATVTEDEFVGPFPSWTNVKTQFGAVGDGVADDTTAIQNGLNALGTGTTRVLYFPAGTYRLTSALILDNRLNVAMVGEDAATTILKWDGVAKPDDWALMIWVNGVAYSKFARLTFDGSETAHTAVWQAYEGFGGHFDTGNEYADMIFQDTDVAIDGGGLDFGFAETSVMRTTFLRQSQAAIILRNFNALDLWVWDSVFEDCAKGITNDPGAGNYRVYNSLFKNSTVTDLEIGNTGFFSARHNTSIDSNRFLSAAGTANPAEITLQGNIILDPVQSTAVLVGNQGPLLMVDNTIRSREGATSPVVSVTNSTADTIAVGNTFTVATPIVEAGRDLIYTSSVVTRASLAGLGEPTMPARYASQNRTIYNVSAGANAATIQAAIDQAVAEGGPKAVVHLPTGDLQHRHHAGHSGE